MHHAHSQRRKTSTASRALRNRGMSEVKPLGDLVLLERIDGDGREEVRPSGIILPARDLSLRHGNTKRIPDTFRARVVAVSDLAAKATEGALVRGVEVLVHTYDQGQERTLATEETRYGAMVSVEDIIGIVEESAAKVDTIAILRRACEIMRPTAADHAANRAAIEAMPLMGVVPKTKDFAPPEPPSSVTDLGFCATAQ